MPDGVRGDLGRVEPERRGHGAVDEAQAAPVVVGVLQSVEEERVGRALVTRATEKLVALIPVDLVEKNIYFRVRKDVFCSSSDFHR